MGKGGFHVFMERIEFKAQFKGFTEDAAGTFEGLAAVFNNLDRAGDIILPGSFVDSLETFKKDGFLANAHDWSSPIGTIEDAVETEEGLLVKGRFHTTPTAQATRLTVKERLDRGKTVAMSIGFMPVEGDYNAETGVRVLKKIDLFEVSIVTVPANPQAQVMGAKGLDAIEQQLAARVQSLRRLYLEALAGPYLKGD